MGEMTPFQLSRIYASGWGAGREFQPDEATKLDVVAEELNPHQAAEERERWSQGFKDAVSRQIATPAKFRRSSPR